MWVFGIFCCHSAGSTGRPWDGGGIVQESPTSTKDVRKDVWESEQDIWLIFLCLKMLEVRIDTVPHGSIVYEFFAFL